MKSSFTPSLAFSEHLLGAMHHTNFGESEMLEDMCLLRELSRPGRIQMINNHDAMGRDS